MQIYNTTNFNPKLSLALGFFDGVHLGHRAVIENAVNFAKANGNKSAVITFSNHPCCYLKNISPEYINTRQERENRIKALGIDYLYELDFGELSNFSAEEYLRNILVKNFSPISISTGWNHCFGFKKSGNVKFLHANEAKYNYKYFELPPQKIDNEIISSTTIRRYLTSGEIKKANAMLGYNFSITGEIVSGNQIGRTIGFPTANIIYPEDIVKLPHGVYSVETNYGKGIANYGTRPTINGTDTLLEVNIIDFNKNIYGETLIVKFNKMIRPERKFQSLDALKKQIQLDIKSV